MRLAAALLARFLRWWRRLRDWLVWGHTTASLLAELDAFRLGEEN